MLAYFRTSIFYWLVRTIITDHILKSMYISVSLPQNKILIKPEEMLSKFVSYRILPFNCQNQLSKRHQYGDVS